MLYKFWKLCNKRKWFSLANALAYYNASAVEWKMLPFFKPPGLSGSRFRSFISGYLTNLHPLGWITEYDSGMVSSKFEPDITMDFKTNGLTITKVRF